MWVLTKRIIINKLVDYKYSSIKKRKKGTPLIKYKYDQTFTKRGVPCEAEYFVPEFDSKIYFPQRVQALIEYLVTATACEWKGLLYCSGISSSAGIVDVYYSTLLKKAEALGL